MGYLTPQGSATFAQPGVEFGKRRPLNLLRIQPNTPAAVLHVLLHDAFLPTAGHVAEVGIEQVMGAHRRESRIDDTTLALLHLVHRSLHVVVDAPTRDAAQGLKGPGVGIEQHFMTLTGVGHQPERAAEAQLQMGNLELVEDAAHHHRFIAPVELKRFTGLERQGHKGLGGLACGVPPGADEVGDAAVTAGVAIGLDLAKQGFGGAPVLLGAVGVGFESQLQRLVKRCEFVGRLLAPVGRLVHLVGAPHPLAYRVARQARGLGYFVQRLLVA